MSDDHFLETTPEEQNAHDANVLGRIIDIVKDASFDGECMAEIVSLLTEEGYLDGTD